MAVGLKAVQEEFNDMMEELRSFAEVMANKHNSLELDENGFYYVVASGPLEDIIPELEKQLKKLHRIYNERQRPA